MDKGMFKAVQRTYQPRDMRQVIDQSEQSADCNDLNVRGPFITLRLPCSSGWLIRITCVVCLGLSSATISMQAQTLNPVPPQDKLTSTSESVPSLPEGSTNGKGLWNRKHLLGDWGGERSALAEKGLKFDIYYVADSLTNLYGGPEDPALWGRVRATADVDFSKFTTWQDLTFHINGLWQYGTDLSSQYTHTLVDSSSLPSSHTLRLGSFFFSRTSFSTGLPSVLAKWPLRTRTATLSMAPHPSIRSLVTPKAT